MALAPHIDYIRVGVGGVRVRVGWGEVGWGWGWGESYLSQMFTFIKMVITGVENGSPDMILLPFDGKFVEKKDEIPPGICRPHI